jgi:nitrogen fixation NifU-like protein
MSDLRELYQSTILDHYKKPRNFGPLADANHHADGYNPLCGDRVTVHLFLDGEVVRDLRFEGSGCAISTASASMMTEVIKGKTRAEAERIFERFHHLVAGPAEALPGPEEVGKLAVFSGVREYPARIKCATLVWHALHSALGDAGTVSTE